ncbi:hypothetical protein KKF60_00995 [Patescibacteria group bacterium]|nr:hypothetical protein [Patescibacteria group bacterium]MBU4458466.1 hypothetical protein [Patescibacteria group bacterium]MCG2696318.1 hypothetical protein [Candidatus Portnoybacteria bacterium]
MKNKENSIEKIEGNIIIPDCGRLEQIKEKIKQGGVDKIHALVDFDRTLTKSFVKGKERPSLISVLRDGNYLTPDYAEKAHALFDKYHSMEIDINLSIEEKKKAMREWWINHFKLLIESGLNKKDLERVVDSEGVEFREGALEFIDRLNKAKIPLVIMSSSGLGGDNIAMFLKKQNRLYDNIHIISNTYIWDKNGNAIGVKEPIVHNFNKDETSIKNFPAFEIVKDRKNVLLLGDSLGDVGMIEGFDYDNLLKIGFLNEKIDESLEKYKENFDVVILNDSDMDYVNDLLKNIAILAQR